MNEQAILKQNYDDCLLMVKLLPREMRAHGVFELEIEVDGGHRLYFSHEGTVQVYDKTYPITSIDKIIGACFDYSIVIRNLQQVVPEHMAKINSAVEKARNSLEDFIFYKK